MTRRQQLPDLTDDEEAEIQRGIASDPDNPEWTDEELARAKPFKVACPDLYASIMRERGKGERNGGR